MKIRQPTTTSLVLDLLVHADDFMSYMEIVKSIGRSKNQVSAALFHLEKMRAIERVEDHWFATPWRDVRLWTLREIKADITKRYHHRKCKRERKI